MIRQLFTKEEMEKEKYLTQVAAFQEGAPFTSENPQPALSQRERGKAVRRKVVRIEVRGAFEFKVATWVIY